MDAIDVAVYHDLKDVPRCGCHGQPQIDMEKLWQYSAGILAAVRKELGRCSKESRKDARSRNPLAYPGTMADEEGMRNYVEGPLVVARDFDEKRRAIGAEIARRGDRRALEVKNNKRWKTMKPKTTLAFFMKIVVVVLIVRLTWAIIDIVW
jgi:hypothetical protein